MRAQAADDGAAGGRVARADLILSEEQAQTGAARNRRSEARRADHGRRHARLRVAQPDALHGLPHSLAGAVALQDDVLPDEPLRRRNRDGEPVCTHAPEREPRLDLLASAERSSRSSTSPGRPMFTTGLTGELQRPSAVLLTDATRANIVEPHCMPSSDHGLTARTARDQAGHRRRGAVDGERGRSGDRDSRSHDDRAALLRVERVAIPEAAGLHEGVRVRLVRLENRRGGKLASVGENLMAHVVPIRPRHGVAVVDRHLVRREPGAGDLDSLGRTERGRDREDGEGDDSKRAASSCQRSRFAGAFSQPLSGDSGEGSSSRRYARIVELSVVA